MNLFLVINSLNCGGAERVMTLLANHWAQQGHRVTLQTLSHDAPFFPLDPRVELLSMRPARGGNPLRSLFELLRTGHLLRRALRRRRPDGVISFAPRVNLKTLLAARGLGLRVVISERNDPSQRPLGRHWSRQRLRWYPRAHRVVVQTESVRQWFADRGVTNTTVVANPVELPLPTWTPPGSPLVLNVGRLVAQKGQRDLIRAVAGLKRDDVRLRILGEGPDREGLRALGDELGLGARLEMPGLVAEKGPHFAQASLFVLSSYYEGFPNALVEAMAAGLPCVSYDCPSGPSDLIDHETNGLLVPLKDVEGLQAAIARGLARPDEAVRWAASAPQAVSSLGVGAIAAQWEALFS